MKGGKVVMQFNQIKQYIDCGKMVQRKCWNNHGKYIFDFSHSSIVIKANEDFPSGEILTVQALRTNLQMIGKL